ncbi:MAG: hypothetical protein ACJ8AI_04815 [Rhodopila sp.]
MQAVAVAAAILWRGGLSFVLLMPTKAVRSLPATGKEEREGAYIVLHGEEVF